MPTLAVTMTGSPQPLTTKTVKVRGFQLFPRAGNVGTITAGTDGTAQHIPLPWTFPYDGQETLLGDIYVLGTAGDLLDVPYDGPVITTTIPPHQDGYGDPNGTVTGNVDDTFTNLTNGGTWLKTSGDGTNTGWTPNGQSFFTAAKTTNDTQWLEMLHDFFVPWDFTKGSVCFWFKAPAQTGGYVVAAFYDFDVGDYSPYSFAISVGGADMLIHILPATGGFQTGYDTTITGICDEEWHCVMFSWDKAVPGNGLLYVDGVASELLTSGASGTVDSTAAWTFWRDLTPADPANPFIGTLGQFWMDSFHVIDWSEEVWRLSFRTGDGKPMYLGSSGELPLGGLFPLCFMQMDINSNVYGAGLNSGAYSVSDQFTVNGVLVDGSTPSP